MWCSALCNLFPAFLTFRDFLNKFYAKTNDTNRFFGLLCLPFSTPKLLVLNGRVPSSCAPQGQQHMWWLLIHCWHESERVSAQSTTSAKTQHWGVSNQSWAWMKIIDPFSAEMICVFLIDCLGNLGQQMCHCSIMSPARMLNLLNSLSFSLHWRSKPFVTSE